VQRQGHEQVALPEEYGHNYKNTIFRREEEPNFNLISLNCGEAIAFAIALFWYKEVYNVIKLRNMVLEKDGEGQLDRSCEK
jgi:hypothetical protein